MLPASTALNGRSRVNIMTVKKMGLITVCCGAALFGSQDKFDSGTGWPSFTLLFMMQLWAQSQSQLFHGSNKYIATSEAHLGHVFEDGPLDAGGLRYCINSVSLVLVAEDGDELT